MSNTNTLTDYVLMPSADYIDMCNAIREKTGITGDLISSQLGNIIRSIQGSVVLPTHTVNFYNDTILLQSYTNVVYGSTITYTGETPTKASTATMSYTFDRFEPSGARITGDTNCYAQFIETAIGGGDEEEPTTGEWVSFCADGTTWTGEEIDIANTGKGVRPTQYSGTVTISPTNQYRFTLGENVYEGVNISEDAQYIMLENCPYQIHMYSETDHRFNFIDSDTEDLYYTGTLKVESWTGSEPYVPEEEGYVPTDGYQAFTTDGTWTGESVTTAYVPTDNINRTFYYRSSDIAYVGSTSLPVDNNTIVLLTVDGVSYECHAALTSDTKNIWYFASDGCPVALGGGYSVGDDSWWLAFTAAGTYTVKVEVKNETETPTLITFSIDGTEYQAEEGMTWNEWIASEYNTDAFAKYPDDDVLDVISQDGDTVYDDNGVVVVTDVIVADYSYWLDCCFVEGTQVMISLDGQTKNIEDIQAGEQVVSYNVETGENYLTTVSKAITNNSSKFMAHVEFENGSELDMTEYHPIYTQNGWRSLTNYNGYDTLVVGDIAKTVDGWSKITDIVRYQNDVRTTTYTLDVVDIGENPDIEINDSFYANGIVVHNSACW